MAIPETIKKLANDIRTKIYGREVREALARGIEAAGDLADKANTKSENAVYQVNNIQAQVNQLVVEGDSSVEAAQARVDAEGNVFATLKERLDTKETQFANEIGILSNDITDLQSQKADITYVNNQLALKRDKSAKITNADLDISTDANKIKLVNLSDEVLQAMAGTTPVNVTPGPNSVTQEKIAPGAVTFEKINEAVRGKNIFNKDTVINNAYIVYDNGQVVTGHPTYCASDFILVEPNTDYYFTKVLNKHYAFYDINKKWIGPSTNGGASTGQVVRTPANASYMRVTLYMTDVASAQIEKGTAGTSYEPYSYTFDYLVLKSSNIPDGIIDKNHIKDQAVSLKSIEGAELGKNLFNKDNVTPDKYVLYSNGQLGDNTNYVATDYIEVEPNTQYTRNYSHQMAFYDANKTYISGINVDWSNIGVTTFTTPANAKYVRLTVAKTAVDTFQLEKGSVATSYEPYGYKLKYLQIPKEEDEFLLFLPSEICIAVGRTIELYNRQVCWTGNINNYHFKWECNVGKPMARKWSCTATSEMIGEYPLTVTVYDNNMDVVAQAQTIVKIVDFDLTTEKKILPIGDSLTNAKPWLAEVRSLSNGKIRFVGTRWNGDVQGGYLNHEGRSGASAKWYLNDSTYDFDNNGVGQNNPFWNPATQKFDFNYYRTTYGINPDAVQIFLGTNGIALDPTENANNIKSIVDGIQESDPDIPIFVVNTLYRGGQDGIGKQLSTDGYSSGSGVWKLEEDRKVFNLMVRLYDLLKDYDNLYFVPVALTHDSEYNFKNPTIKTPVNPRSEIATIEDVEATHPQVAGYLQMADIIFSTYAAHLK